MTVFSIWDARFPEPARAAGLQTVQAIWADMQSLEGYVSHELIEHLDDPGHLLVLSRWTSRERADITLREYADNPNRVRADQLVSTPRTRFVGRLVDRS
jgi:quinol monooxygenase YgiN